MLHSRLSSTLRRTGRLRTPPDATRRCQQLGALACCAGRSCVQSGPTSYAWPRTTQVADSQPCWKASSSVACTFSSYGTYWPCSMHSHTALCVTVAARAAAAEAKPGDAVGASPCEDESCVCACEDASWLLWEDVWEVTSAVCGDSWVRRRSGGGPQDCLGWEVRGRM